MEPRDVQFFERSAAFRRWLEIHGSSASDLWVGYHRKATGRPSMSWAESVDEALCFGWIDSIRQRVGEDSYANRFTPRRAGSTWSRKNVARVLELIEEGRMAPAGLAAFESRSEANTGVYSYENEEASLTSEEELRFRANADAWSWWDARPPGYRKTVTRWVTSAKKPETRAKRLDELIADSAAGLPIKAMRYGRDKG